MELAGHCPSCRCLTDEGRAVLTDSEAECACRVCECWEPALEGSTLCLGCEHNAHPGEVE